MTTYTEKVYDGIDMIRREVTIGDDAIVEYDHGELGRSVYINDKRAAVSFAQARRLAESGETIPLTRFRA